MKTLFTEIIEILSFEKKYSTHLVRSKIVEEVKLSLASLALLIIAFSVLMLVFAIVDFI